MAMTYDLPTVSQTAEPFVPLQGFEAHDVKPYAASQMVEQGAAMSKVGAVIGQIATDLRNTIDTAQAKEADNTLAEHVRGVLYDPENGYLATERKDALSRRPDAAKAIQEKLKETEGTLKNDMQRRMFRKAANARLQSAMLQIDGHAMHQAKEYNAGQTMARIDSLRLDAIANYPDWQSPEGQFQVKKQKMLGEVAELADLRGIPQNSAQYEMLHQAATTQLHAEVLNNMVSSGNTKAAKDYYDKHVTEILADKRDDIQKVIKTATTATEADNLAAKVWAEHGPKNLNDGVAVFTMSERIRALAGDNEDVQRAAIAGIKERAGEWNGQQVEMRSQNVAGVWKQIDAGQSLKKVQLSSAWLSLSDTERHTIRKQLDEEAGAREGRELTRLQRQEHLALLRNADEYLTITDPKVLSQMSRAQVEAQRGKFGLTATQHLLGQWDAIQNPKKFGEAKMDQDDFNNLALNLGLDPLSKNKDTRNRIGTLKFHIEQAIDIEQSQRKAPMDRQEKMEFVKKEMSKQVLLHNSILPNHPKPVLALTSEDKKRVVIPEDQLTTLLEDMKTMYKKTGDPIYLPTKQNQVYWYLKKKSPAAAADFSGDLTNE